MRLALTGIRMSPIFRVGYTYSWFIKVIGQNWRRSRDPAQLPMRLAICCSLPPFYAPAWCIGIKAPSVRRSSSRGRDAARDSFGVSLPCPGDLTASLFYPRPHIERYYSAGGRLDGPNEGPNERPKVAGDACHLGSGRDLANARVARRGRAR